MMQQPDTTQRLGPSRPRLSRRRFVAVIGFALAALAAACTTGAKPKPGGGSGGAGDGSDVGEIVMEIEMGDSWFGGPQVRNGGRTNVASEITVPANRPIRFHLRNVGQLIHNFHIFTEKDGDSIAVSVPEIINPGEEGDLVITFSEPGTLFYWCDFHPFTMFGNLEVTPT